MQIGLIHIRSSIKLGPKDPILMENGPTSNTNSFAMMHVGFGANFTVTNNKRKIFIIPFVRIFMDEKDYMRIFTNSYFMLEKKFIPKYIEVSLACTSNNIHIEES